MPRKDPVSPFMTIRFPSVEDLEQVRAAATADHRSMTSWVWLAIRDKLDRLKSARENHESDLR